MQIRGTIYDDLSGSPIQGAKLFTFSRGGGILTLATTQRSGFFCMSYPDELSNTIFVKMDGYITQAFEPEELDDIEILLERINDDAVMSEPVKLSNVAKVVLACGALYVLLKAI